MDFESNCAPYYRLRLAPDPRTHGYVHPDTVARMPWPAFFAIDHADRAVTLEAPPANTSLTAHANAAFQTVVDAAIDADTFPVLHSDHSEPFRVVGAREPVQLERFAAPLFGIACRGAHLTCYVRSASDGSPRIWVARRSASLFTYPGMLDSTVAGGVKASHTPMDCILAEAKEEACLPEPLVRARVRPVGAVTMANRDERNGLVHADILYAYDMELPVDVVPTPGDDEVAEFVLMGCDEVRRRMLAGEFKPNVCPVMIDFMVRHGELTPEGEPDYVKICQRLKRRIPVPTTAEGEL